MCGKKLLICLFIRKKHPKSRVTHITMITAIGSLQRARQRADFEIGPFGSMLYFCLAGIP